MTSPDARTLARTARVLGREQLSLSEHGYVDLLGEHPTPPGMAQLLMRTRVVPLIYERWWRPVLGRLAKGLRGPSMAEELRLARQLLALRTGATVIDVACGPGNFTRRFAEDVGSSGTVVAVDTSATMLARAVGDTPHTNVVYVRADAARLPVRASTVDAVCCFAALHLFDDPWTALDVMATALVPGGRLALLTTVRPTVALRAAAAELGGRLSGVRMFGADELRAALVERGLDVVDQRRFGSLQMVGARRGPSAG